MKISNVFIRRQVLKAGKWETMGKLQEEHKILIAA